MILGKLIDSRRVSGIDSVFEPLLDLFTHIVNGVFRQHVQQVFGKIARCLYATQLGTPRPDKRLRKILRCAFPSFKEQRQIILRIVLVLFGLQPEQLDRVAEVAVLYRLYCFGKGGIARVDIIRCGHWRSDSNGQQH